MNDERLAYRVEEVVKLTGLGRSKLYEEMAAGRLKAKKLGSRTIILKDDLLQFLAGLGSV